MIKIELATQNQLDRVKEIAEACAKNMIENNKHMLPLEKLLEPT